MKNIVLIGFMGTGKSTIAMEMSRRHAMDMVEMDQLIVEREGMSIPDIFEKYGEAYFRDLETHLLKEIQDKTNQIVSCGGGVVLRECNIEAMKKNGKVILLTAEPATILERVKEDEDRPILKGRKNVVAIAELMEARKGKYEAAADIVIATDGKTVQQICDEILQRIDEREE